MRRLKNIAHFPPKLGLRMAKAGFRRPVVRSAIPGFGPGEVATRERIDLAWLRIEELVESFALHAHALTFTLSLKSNVFGVRVCANSGRLRNPTNGLAHYERSG